MTVLSEKNETYVDVEFLDELTYLNDGKHFIHLSERSGFKHLYLYDVNGSLIRLVTTGNFEVSEFLGLDEKLKTVYFTSTEVSPLEKHLFSISLDGKRKQDLLRPPAFTPSTWAATSSFILITIAVVHNQQ